jgi:hypothetical protein
VEVRAVPHLIRVRHATPARNVPSIVRRGLLPSLALGKLKAVWLHTPSRSAWAVAHVAERHHVQEDLVCVLSLLVPRSQLRKRGRGVWVAARPVSPEWIVSVRPMAFAS